MITTQILADSINLAGCRPTTFLLTYPRFIHSEFMTHRAFSRNAASSRAIPIDKMLNDIRENPALPERWGAERKGMQSGEALDSINEKDAQLYWRCASDLMRDSARDLQGTGLHKSLCNRIIEPWAHITVIATATDRGLGNFFGLRAHVAAMPEFQVLAFRMLRVYLDSVPRSIPWGGWHLPYCDEKIYTGHAGANARVISACIGRVARVSYNRQDVEDEERNIELHDRLAASGHWSPFEHVARAWGIADDRHSSNFDVGYDSFPRSSWVQYRKSFKDECSAPDLEALMAAKPEWVTL